MTYFAFKFTKEAIFKIVINTVTNKITLIETKNLVKSIIWPKHNINTIQIIRDEDKIQINNKHLDQFNGF